MRIWDCLILLDIGVTRLRAEGAGESIKSGTNLSLNKLRVSPRSAIQMPHYLRQVVDPLCSNLQSVMRTAAPPITTTVLWEQKTCSSQSHGEGGLRGALGGPALARSYRTHWPGRQPRALWAEWPIPTACRQLYRRH